jgi:16S rRNA processing protein RimM
MGAPLRSVPLAAAALRFVLPLSRLPAMTAALPTLTPATLPADAVEVGRIADAWGIKGWFKLIAHSSDPQALMHAPSWFLQPAEKGAKTFTGTATLPIQQVRWHGDGLVATSPAVTDRNAAEALRGARIFIAREHFPQADEGEYYWVDLLGLAVRNREGLHLGSVKDLLSTGPQTVLVVAYMGEDGKELERMIPFVDAYIDHVDLPGKTITADWQPDY